MKKRVIICLDGCSPAYLDQSEVPNMDRLAGEGFRVTGRAVMPSVTNVNNVTIVTASYPELHGITSNYYLDPASGEAYYMESSQFVQAETLFRRVNRFGGRSALLTAKEKLKNLIQDGADYVETAENPSAWLVDRIGSPPEIYSIEVNHWLFQAARILLAERPIDTLYLTTTDYVNHKFGPESERSQWNMNRLDQLLGDILNLDFEIELVITADHGMNAKTRALDLNRILKAAGIAATVIPIIKDRYVVHHQNLGGSAYVYMEDVSAAADAAAVLHAEAGIESVLWAEKAARRYRLHSDRIGQLFVLADKITVFGDLPQAREEVVIRSHGSLYEVDIPIIGYGQGPLSMRPASNHEITAWIDRDKAG